MTFLAPLPSRWPGSSGMSGCRDILPISDEPCECVNIEKSHRLLWRVGCMEFSWHHQLQPMFLHLVCLILADRGFERQQMFVLDAPCFCQHLAPPVLTRAFHAQHCQQDRIEVGVPVFF